MRRIIFTFTLLLIQTCLSSQTLVARIDLRDDSIAGLCDQDQLYALMNYGDDQKEPACSMTKTEMLDLLETKLKFVKENPKYKGYHSISLFINCNGELVKVECESKKPELDKQLVEIFKNGPKWTAGELYGKNVDGEKRISISIKKGVITINNTYWN